MPLCCLNYIHSTNGRVRFQYNSNEEETKKPVHVHILPLSSLSPQSVLISLFCLMKGTKPVVIKKNVVWSLLQFLLLMRFSGSGSQVHWLWMCVLFFCSSISPARHTGVGNSTIIHVQECCL